MFQAWTSQTCTKGGSSLVIQSASCGISKNLSSSCKSLARIQSALEIKPRRPPNATVVKASTGGAFFNGSRRVSPSRSRSTFMERWMKQTQKRSPMARNDRMTFLSPVFILAQGSREFPNLKIQAPKNPKLEIPNGTESSLAPRCLELGIRSFSGVWSLEFSLRSLRRGQFATGEQGDSAQRDDATKEKDHLTDSQAKLAPRHAAAGAQRINRRKVLGQPDHAENLREHPESGLIEE